MKAEFAARTDVGLKRKYNEDSFLVDELTRVFVVADGMGGHAAGDVASKLAVEAIWDFFRQVPDPSMADAMPFGQDGALTFNANRLTNAVKKANNRIRDISTSSEEMAGMGTTVTAAVLDGGHATVANVGDSRCYLFSQTGFKLLTEDHSWVNEQLRKNLITEEDAKNHPWRNVITRALGSRDVVDVDVFEYELKDGDVLCLCTDGLTTMVEDVPLFDVITKQDAPLAERCEQIVELAKENGGQDNITVILLEVRNA